MTLQHHSWLSPERLKSHPPIILLSLIYHRMKSYIFSLKLKIHINSPVQNNYVTVTGWGGCATVNAGKPPPRTHRRLTTTQLTSALRPSIERVRIYSEKNTDETSQTSGRSWGKNDGIAPAKPFLNQVTNSAWASFFKDWQKKQLVNFRIARL